jgi:putative PIN family toxin of toxin-antitoxin system
LRAVLDPNVLISAPLSADGKPYQLLRRWSEGDFELVVSTLLLSELERALGYPKVSKRMKTMRASDLVRWLLQSAMVVGDPADQPEVESRDSGDNYLLALREATDAFLVSGDCDLLELRNEAPIVSPAEFDTVLDSLSTS